MTDHPTVLTIILNYKTADMTLKSAEAALVAMEGIAGAITIVDNDSQDGSFETISAEAARRGWDPARIRVIQSGHNGGFGAGNNFGIRHGLPDGSSPDFVYLQNSDAFPEPGAIRALVSHLQGHPNTAFAGSHIYGSDQVTHVTTFRFPTLASEFARSIRSGPITRLLSKYRVPIETPGDDTEVQWVAGASLMMRYDVLKDIGVFDEVFFLYYEETDLCRRVKMAGYDIDHVKESRVEHIGSVSTGMKKWNRTPNYWFDSRWHYFSKNHGYVFAVVASLIHLFGGTIFYLRCLLTRKQNNMTQSYLRDLLVHDAKSLALALVGRRPKPRQTLA